MARQKKPATAAHATTVHKSELEAAVTSESQAQAHSPKKKKTSSAQKKNKKQSIIEIPQEQYFILCDGRSVKDYRELADILASLRDDVFYYHVNESKNDFANWINDVFAEQELADAIRSLRERMHIRAEIYRYMLEQLEKSL